MRVYTLLRNVRARNPLPSPTLGETRSIAAWLTALLSPHPSPILGQSDEQPAGGCRPRPAVVALLPLWQPLQMPGEAFKPLLLGTLFVGIAGSLSAGLPLGESGVARARARQRAQSYAQHDCMQSCEHSEHPPLSRARAKPLVACCGQVRLITCPYCHRLPVRSKPPRAIIRFPKHASISPVMPGSQFELDPGSCGMFSDLAFAAAIAAIFLR